VKEDYMTKLLTEAFKRLLMERRAKLYRVKADLLEMLIPVLNYEEFTEPEWEALVQINQDTSEILNKIDDVLTHIESIKP
jgi:hypothetical protein